MSVLNGPSIILSWLQGKGSVGTQSVARGIKKTAATFCTACIKYCSCLCQTRLSTNLMYDIRIKIKDSLHSARRSFVFCVWTPQEIHVCNG
jgi:hypothetical protein